MAKHQEEKHLNAKQLAYEKKQAAKGEKIVKWIFGVLVVCALCFMVYSVWLAS
jgi:hypothetical protein